MSLLALISKIDERFHREIKNNALDSQRCQELREKYCNMIKMACDAHNPINKKFRRK